MKTKILVLIGCIAFILSAAFYFFNLKPVI
jgi:hypothetical protein